MQVRDSCNIHLLKDFVNTSESTFLLSGGFLLVMVKLVGSDFYSSIIQV